MSKINIEHKARKLKPKRIHLTQKMRALLTLVAASQGFMNKSPVELYNLLNLFADAKPWGLLTEQDRDSLRQYMAKWNVEDFL